VFAPARIWRGTGLCRGLRGFRSLRRAAILAGAAIARRCYAVFDHRGPLSALQHTVGAIFDEWLPNSGSVPAEGPLAFFERYGTNFDARSGQGDVEIWLPVAPPTQGD